MNARARREPGLSAAVLSIAAGLGIAALVALHRDTYAAAVPALGSDSLCERYSGLPPQFGTAARAGMVAVPGGSYEPGSTSGYADERPSGPVRVGPFWIDRTEVTNAQFAAFVEATGHVTQAEREGAAAVFRAPAPGRVVAPNSWWVWTRGASWRHPEGPGSDLRGRAHLPVVHVTYDDALAYARWLGHDLPTEAEWEYAARGNGQAEVGEPRDAAGHPRANFWQGVFPDVNTKEDGHAALAPVGCYAANGFGLHDMIGNAWELTRDRYTGARQPHNNGSPEEASGRMAVRAAAGERLVIKGGSFLCAANYCVRYRSSAREAQDADIGASHVGFRTVWRGA